MLFRHYYGIIRQFVHASHKNHFMVQSKKIKCIRFSKAIECFISNTTIYLESVNWLYAEKCVEITRAVSFSEMVICCERKNSIGTAAPAKYCQLYIILYFGILAAMRHMHMRYAALNFTHMYNIYHHSVKPLKSKMQ